MKVKLFGKRGLFNRQRLREADGAPDPVAAPSQDMQALQGRVVSALNAQIGTWFDVVAFFADSIVVNLNGAKKRYPFTEGASGVVFGAAEDVVADYKPLADTIASADSTSDAAAFVEAVNGRDDAYVVRVISSGLSKNRNYYSDTLLRESAAKFNGARVFAKSDAAHISGAGKDVRNLIGGLSEAKFVEGVASDRGEIRATLSLITGDADPIAIRMREAMAKGMTDLFGLSVDVEGRTRVRNGMRIAESFQRINSVDVIVDPGAGGQLIAFREAVDPNAAPPADTTPHKTDGDALVMDRDALIALIKEKAPALLEGKDIDALTDDDLQALVEQALAAANAAANTAPAAADTAIVEAVNARMMLENRLAATQLPEVARGRIRNQFARQARFSEAAVTAAITSELRYVEAVGGGSGYVSMGTGRVVGGATQRDQHAAMLDAFLDPRHRDHRQARSFRECYVQITGDANVSGQVRNAARMTEAASMGTDSFPLMLGDSLTRRMVAEYRGYTDLDAWKLLTGAPVPVSDFRSQKRLRMGGFGSLPIVAERAPYTDLGTPGEESAEYRAAKRGGLAKVTREMIKNDDVGTIRQIPVKMARAAKRTLFAFVFDFLKTNAPIYDGKALFHADHKNLSTLALSDATIAAMRLAMVKQTEQGSNEALGFPPKYLFLPADLEQKAYDLFRRDTNHDETFVQTLKPTLVPVYTFTDPNDFYMAADPVDVQHMEIGFMDGNEEPETFVQDAPDQGSMFSNDELTYKIRHEYGAAMLDYRGLQGAIVA